MIQVEVSPTASGWDATVEVDAGTDHASRHNVRVSHSDMGRWGRGGTPEELIRRAFDFLLQRESPQQVLKSFDLSDIESYFPEFGREMGA